MNATSQTTTELSADDMDSLQTGDVITVSYETRQAGNERSFEAEVTDTDLTRMDAGEHGMVLIGSVTLCRTVTDKTGDEKANDDFPRRRLQASAGSLSLKSRSTTRNGAVWSRMASNGTVTVTQTEETETEDDDEDSGSRDAFSTCLNCSTETDDTFCEDCSPETEDEEAEAVTDGGRVTEATEPDEAEALLRSLTEGETVRFDGDEWKVISEASEDFSGVEFRSLSGYHPGTTTLKPSSGFRGSCVVTHSRGMGSHYGSLTLEEGR